MRLKTLEVQGYKSFANKVEFAFDNGITAIVGPNGCGKSNVADAIRWVLGEQGYSNLRGKKTEDMIFSGSDGRARLGMASATLVLDNNDKWLPLDFSEVTIARRAYRSGDNEYYLNGSRVRLKDINELLAKSGLSRQTYTVIGQGTIDRVLSLHADERRQLFEEASGIVFHRQKRAKTLDQLDATQTNVLRLNDIIKEIEPRLNRLEKQAERAEEHALLMTHLDGLLRIWYGFRWGQAQQELRDAKRLQGESEKVVRNQLARLADLERELGALRREQTELRAKLGAHYAEDKAFQAQSEAVQRQLAVGQERASQYAAQRAEILAEIEPLAANVNLQDRLQVEAQAKLVTIEAELGHAEVKMQEAQQNLELHQAQRQELSDRYAEAEARRHHLHTVLTERQSRLTQLGERLESLQAERGSRAAGIAQLTEQRGELLVNHEQSLAGLAVLDEELRAVDTHERQQREALAELDRETDRLEAKLAALQRQEDSLKAREDVLGKLRFDMTGYYEGVRTVLQPEAGLSGIIGTVSQIMHVPPELEAAIETAVGSRLQDVVVETFAEAEAAISFLRENKRGRATFLPLDTIRAGRAVSAPATSGVVGLASELVKVEAQFRSVVESTLNQTVIVDDLPAARRAFAALKGSFQIVTREGELMRSGGAVTGGRDGDKQRQRGMLLAREREWRDLPQQFAQVAQGQQSLSRQLDTKHEQTASVEAELQSTVATKQQKRDRRQEVQAVTDRINLALTQLTDNIGWQEDLQRKVEDELENLERRQNEIRDESTKLEHEHAEAERAVHRLAEEAKLWSAETLLAELNRARSEVALIREQQKNHRSILENYQTSAQHLAEQIEGKRSRAETLARELEALHQEQVALQTEREAFNQQSEKFTVEIDETEHRLAELESRQSKLEQAETGLRQHLHRVEAEQNRISLAAARRQDDLDNLQRQIQDDLGLVNLEMSDEQIGQPVLPIRPLVSDLPVVDTLPPGVEEDVRRLKIQVRRLGSVNPDAPREYAELGERHSFLTSQMADLEAAAADLKAIIARLDETMEAAFTNTFQLVTKEFQRYFKALFGGGEAKLILTDPDNLIETGVDIVARPPGKRLQSLALLSGGERSLTAQALIFALLRTSPTPFVIFDEVDAMLDEANVSRFREALAGLADDIQFIIITHNRKTIEAAQTIYGISMGDDSVSQAYSLKLDEWLETDG